MKRALGRAARHCGLALMALAAVVTVWPSSVMARPHDSVLGDSDADSYRRIFMLQDSGRMAEADRLIARLDDKVLMGHVLFQRYMHPTAYRTHFAELRDWLAAYGDHPGSGRVYELAGKRGKGALSRPTWREALGGGGSVSAGALTLAVSRGDEARTVWNQFRRALQHGHTLVVKRLVDSEETARLAPEDRARMQSALAYAYFIDGRDDWAMQWADQARRTSDSRGAQLAYWTAGLTHWRSGNIEAARADFAKLSELDGISPWLASAGAYWAARAALRTRHPQEVSTFLTRAADYPRTFYGLLARRALGLPLAFQWETDGLSHREIQQLERAAAGRRALALVQVGQLDLAEQELRGLWGDADAAQRSAIIRLANTGGMTSLAYRLGQNTAAEEEVGISFDVARYPVPTWQPEGGWRLDRALLFAFMRQESGFNPDASSYAGAQGLMQVMPATAAFIAGDPDLRGRSGRKVLLTPEVNLELGQKYLEHLLALPEVKGDLFRTAIAYNAGPGNLARWEKRVPYGDDGLLFIESIPSRETRTYVERVLSNLWIYRDRLGQDCASLDMVVAGDWPRYTPQDAGGTVVARRDD